MVFNPAPLIIASMNFARRMREQEKEKQLAEEEKKDNGNNQSLNH